MCFEKGTIIGFESNAVLPCPAYIQYALDASRKV